MDPRVERTRATVIAAVQRLFRDEGPGSVTFGRVSRETGVSRTTLYRHWDTPSDLVADAWRARTEHLQPPHTDDLRRDLLAIGRHLRNVVESRVLQRALPTFLAAALDDPVIEELYATYVRDRSRPALERLAAARDAGEIAEDADPDLLLDQLAGAIYYRQLLRREPTSDEQVEAIVDAVLVLARTPHAT